MNILDEIVLKTKSKLEEKTRDYLEELSSKIDFENLKETNFKKSLQNKAEAIIAEIKKHLQAQALSVIILIQFQNQKNMNLLEPQHFPFSQRKIIF